jgi:hypothetical protein
MEKGKDSRRGTKSLTRVDMASPEFIGDHVL